MLLHIRSCPGYLNAEECGGTQCGVPLKIQAYVCFHGHSFTKKDQLPKWWRHVRSDNPDQIPKNYCKTGETVSWEIPNVPLMFSEVLRRSG